jgi:ParB-like chromosome segregation protein Spo0J
VSSIHPIENLHPHPLADDVPSPTPDEYDALFEDIERRGIVEPIEALPNGTILDGHTRYAIARSLNLQEVPVRFVEPSDPYDFMIRAALLRRHLTTAQRKELAGRLLQKQPERSDRQIAKDTGLSHPTVAAVREELIERGDVEELSTRTDSLGRQQPVVHSPAEMVVTDRHRERFPQSVAAVETAERRARLARAINAFGKGLDALRLEDFAADLDAFEANEIEDLRRCIRQAGKWTDEWATAVKPRRLHAVEGAAR